MLSVFSYTSYKMLGIMLRVTVLALAAWMLAGCSFLSRPGALFGGRATVEARLATGLNGNQPLAVDLVVVYDAKLEKELLALTADQWFAQRSQYLAVSPDPSLEVHSWQWVPGQRVPARPIDYRLGAVTTIIYAAYASEGPHRSQVSPERDLLLLFGAQDFRVEVQ